MVFRPFEASIPHIFYAVLGGFVVLFGMFSLLIREKLYFGEAPLAFVFGVIVGPYGANIFDPRSWGGGGTETVNEITLEVSRVILAVGVFAIGVELPKAYMAKHWRSLLFLLGPVMAWGWVVSAGLIFALIPGLNFLSSLAIAACLTPTDPILAAAVVGGKYADKHVPAHLRHLLAAESGCNDGAAFPFLYLALYLITEKSDRHAIQDWFLITWLYEVVLGIVLGALIGFAFRHLMKFCERKDLIDRQSYVAQYVSLAMFTIGVCTMLGSDDLLAAFSCGAAFAWDGFFNRQTEQAVFSSVIDLLFNIAAFIFIGAWMPFNEFDNAQLTLSVWRLIVIAILVLLLRRLPVVLALYRWIPDIKTFREAVFSGHFGPIGVGAVFISTLAASVLQAPEEPPANQEQLVAASIQPIVAFMVLCSITIHGLSIPFFTFGRAVHSVSRTWSRHQSMDPLGPEWAQHTRRISRPEDIVINRDSAMERGEIVADEKGSPVLTEKESPSGSSRQSTLPSPLEKPAAAPEGDETAMTEGRPDSPPDGEELRQEWREGRDVVIENRREPGDEVDVEVLRNVALPDDAPKSHLSPERLEQAARRVGEHIKRSLPHGERMQFKDAMDKALDDVASAISPVTSNDEHEVPQDAQLSPRALEKRPATASSEEGNAVPSSAKFSKSSRSSRSGPEDPGSGDEEDGGWMSDRSERSVDHDSNAGGDEQGKRRSKSPRQRVAFRPAAHHRRKTSIRRGILGKSHRPASSDGVLESVTDSSRPVTPEEEDRGRENFSQSAPSSLRQRPRMSHRRVDSLMEEASRHTSRSSSPARSILNNRGGDDASSMKNDDSPTTPRVAFDLPDTPK